MKYRCVAFDRSGRRIEEVVDAASESEATDSLGRRGLFVLEVEQDRGVRPSKQRAGGFREAVASAGASRQRNLAAFARQLSVLVSTGTPLVQALEAIERQTREERFRSVVGDVRQRVEEGSTLADAMEAHPNQFDAVARSLVAAGESGGHLDSMLARLSALTRQQAVMRSSITGAMVYPSLLLVVAGAVLVLMISFVIPRFGGMFDTLDTPLPPSTAVLMETSEVFRAYWWGVVPSAGLLGFGGVFWLTTPAGRRSLDTFMIRAPKIGAISRNLSTARIARLLGVLLESRVPLLEALALTRQAMTNVHYASLLERVEERVTRGEAMSNALEEGKLVSPSFCEAVRSGEQSGRVGTVLVNLADYMDEDNAVVVKSIASIIEPVILIVLGLVVGFVAVSMFLPLFDVTAAV